MADKKISQLTSLAQGDIATTTDVLAIVDTSATETKKATPAAIVGAAAAAGLTNVDINSGAIDGTAIGANSASTGAFTTLSASGSVTLSGGTANGVLYLDGSKVATSGSALTFDGSNGLGVGAGGTGNTTALLTLKGGSGATGGSAITGTRNNAGSWFIGDTQTALGSGSGLIYYNYVNSDPWIWYDGGASAERMRLTSNLLITNGQVQVSAGSGSSYSARLSCAYGFPYVDTYLDSYAGTSYSGRIIFRTNSNDGAMTERAIIDSSGNLGIGTSSPSAKLSVSGGNIFVDNANGSVIVRNADATNQQQIRLRMASNDGVLDVTRASGTAPNLIFGTEGSEKMRLTDGGNLGIGTSSPSYKLDVAGDARSNSWIGRANGSAPTADCAVFRPADNSLGFSTANTERARFDSSGNLGIGTSSPTAKLKVVASSATYINPQVMVGEDSDATGKQLHIGYNTTANTGYIQAVHNGTGYKDLIINPNGGNLGLGVTPSAVAASDKVVQVGSFLFNNNTNGYGILRYNNFYNGSNDVYYANGTASAFQMAGNAFRWYQAASGTAGNAISFTQAMTLDADGDLGVGTTSPTTVSNYRAITVNGTNGGILDLKYGDTLGGRVVGNSGGLVLETGTSGSNLMAFYTNNTERARITAGGTLLVAKTSEGAPATAGCEFSSTGGVFTRDSGDPLLVNRQTDDGTLVTFRQDNVTEGTISVSGNTVSYNAFAGSHWSQLQDGSKPDILRGTVMESINELCVWPGENNERLPKAKISDTAGSKKVYGVFMAWDNDWTETNDMYVTAVGAFICRVNGSVTVQEGDLLESNGDGTARVQADDIIRSSTIGKVTSTVKTHQYDDGSYCVPTVLYCG